MALGLGAKLLTEADDLLRDLVSENLVGSKRTVEDGFSFKAVNYVRLVWVVNALNKCHDEMGLPRTRQMVKGMMDACLGRLVELKRELTETAKSDFAYLDKFQLNQKVTRGEVELSVPSHYALEREPVLRGLDELAERVGEKPSRQELVEEAAADDDEWALLDEDTKAEEAGEEDKEEEEKVPEVDLEEEEEKQEGAVFVSRRVVEVPKELLELRRDLSLIQRHERYRRVRLARQRQLEAARVREDMAWLRHKPIPPDLLKKSILTIHRYWKGYRERRRYHALNVKRNIILGVHVPNYSDKSVIERLKKVPLVKPLRFTEEEERREAEEMERKYLDDMTQRIEDEIRYWIKKWFATLREAEVAELPQYPPLDKITPGQSMLGLTKENLAKIQAVTDVENSLMARLMTPIGGSALVASGQWVSPELYIETTKRFKLNPEILVEHFPNEPKDDPQALLSLNRQIAAEKKKLTKTMAQQFIFPLSNFLQKMQAYENTYSLEWKEDIASGHVRECEDRNRANQSSRRLHFRLRDAVDELMQLELERLKETMLGPPKPERAKKGGRKGRKKKKKGKTVDEMVVELIENGILKKREDPPSVGESHWDSCYSNFEKVFYETEPPEVCAKDVVQCLKEYVSLSLGNEQGPKMFKSIMLVGPKAKTEFLVLKASSEAGALVLHLDPIKVGKRYKKAKQFNTTLLKVAKTYEPTVIMVPEADKPFRKKLLPEEKPFVGLLKKGLKGLMKGILNKDKIMVIGMSEEPWLAPKGKILPLFQTIIRVPEEDPRTLKNYWQKKLLAYQGVDREFPLAGIASTSKWQPLEKMDEVIGKVMTQRRLMRLKFDPLDPQELDQLICPPDENGPLVKQWMEEVQPYVLPDFTRPPPLPPFDLLQDVPEAELEAHVDLMDPNSDEEFDSTDSDSEEDLEES